MKRTLREALAEICADYALLEVRAQLLHQETQRFGARIRSVLNEVPAFEDGVRPVDMLKDARADVQRACLDKRRYATPELAGKAAEKAKATHGNVGDGLRIYPCSICSGYHLTSRTLKRFAEGRA